MYLKAAGGTSRSQPTPPASSAGSSTVVYTQFFDDKAGATQIVDIQPRDVTQPKDFSLILFLGVLSIFLGIIIFALIVRRRTTNEKPDSSENTPSALELRDTPSELRQTPKHLETVGESTSDAVTHNTDLRLQRESIEVFQYPQPFRNSASEAAVHSPSQFHPETLHPTTPLYTNHKRGSEAKSNYENRQAPDGPEVDISSTQAIREPSDHDTTPRASLAAGSLTQGYEQDVAHSTPPDRDLSIPYHEPIPQSPSDSDTNSSQALAIRRQLSRNAAYRNSFASTSLDSLESGYPATLLPVYDDALRSHSPPAYSDLSRVHSVRARSDASHSVIYTPSIASRSLHNFSVDYSEYFARNPEALWPGQIIGRPVLRDLSIRTFIGDRQVETGAVSASIELSSTTTG